MSSSDKNRYAAIIETIFASRYKAGIREIDFERTEFEPIAKELNIKLPLNLGDIVYSFRYRAALPDSIQTTAGEGECWIIRPTGKGKYKFALVPDKPIVPNANMTITN